jgi:hypothetical protein
MPKEYRGTVEYIRVLAELVRAAEYKGLTTYQDIALLMGLPTKGNRMGKETGQILGEISEDEVKAGRPMLSAVAVNVSGKPGPGFLGLARKMGKLPEADPAKEHLFWEQERKAVYKTWHRPLPKGAQVAATRNVRAGADA